MELKDIMLNRRSIRKFKKDKISKEDIDTLLHYAMSAPSACNRQPWEFYVVTNEEKLEELESMSYIAVMDMQVENMGYVYPKAIADILPVNSKGISYNEKTNTLTLNNFKTNNI